MYGEQARFFDDEIRPHLRHKKKGLVSMAAAGKNLNASQFFITTAVDLDSLDDKHTIFGEVGFCMLPRTLFYCMCATPTTATSHPIVYTLFTRITAL